MRISAGVCDPRSTSARISRTAAGCRCPGFYRIDQGHYVLARNLNGVRAPVYERTDLRMNKDYVHQKVQRHAVCGNHQRDQSHEPGLRLRGPVRSSDGRDLAQLLQHVPDPALARGGVCFLSGAALRVSCVRCADGSVVHRRDAARSREARKGSQHRPRREIHLASPSSLPGLFRGVRNRQRRTQTRVSSEASLAHGEGRAARAKDATK